MRLNLKKFELLRRRTKILGVFLSLELIHKAVLFVSGMFIIRQMEKTEYAWYSIANSMIGSMAILTSLGVSVALTSLGGERFGNRVEMGRLVTTCYQYRLIFASIFLPIILGVMGALLWTNGCPALYVFTISSLVVTYFVLQLNQGFAISILQLSGDYNTAQSVSATTAIGRLAILVVISLVSALQVWTVLLITTFSQLAGYLLGNRPRSLPHYDRNEPSDPAVAKRIRRVTYDTLPETLKAFFMPQLNIFLISIFSTVDSVADLGALGRLAMLFSIPSSINGSIVRPWLARSPRSSLLRNYLHAVALGTVAAATILISILIFPSLWLKLLGPQYSGLEVELCMVGGLQASHLILSTLTCILMARAWTHRLWVIPVINIAITISLATIVDYSHLQSVLWMNYAQLVPTFVLTLYLVAKGFRHSSTAGPSED